MECRSNGQPCLNNGGCWEPELLEENDAVLELFLSLDHQWKRHANGRRAGLDYLALEAATRLSGTTIEPDDFACIQAMEREVLNTREQPN